MCKAPKVKAPATVQQAPAPTPAPAPAPAPAQAQAPAPAQPAASPADLAKSQEVRDENMGDGTNIKAKKRGRNALRIDLQAGDAGAGGQGLNVPRA